MKPLMMEHMDKSHTVIYAETSVRTGMAPRQAAHQQIPGAISGKRPMHSGRKETNLEEPTYQTVCVRP